MEERIRADRHESLLSPEIMRGFRIEQSAWHETCKDIDRGVAWGLRKAVLLAWVREQMHIALTARERHCLELYYFRGLTYREAGAATSTNASSVYRAVKRAIRKLRKAAEELKMTL
jgi:RNA polymerase sigma factor (sigma-70 family)